MTASATPYANDTREHAARLRQRGIAICLVDKSEKKPTYKRWGTFSKEPHQLKQDDSIGIISGPISAAAGHSLVIVDLDSRSALELADSILPATGMIEGRPGKLRSHRYYIVPNDTIPTDWQSKADQAAKAAIEKYGHPGPRIMHFKGADGKGSLDFIGTGGMIVCPPSRHESGEYREWEGGSPGEPVIIDYRELLDLVKRLAEACGWKPGASQKTAPPKRDQKLKYDASVESKAIKYFESVPGAIDGQDGSSTGLWAARCAVRGFKMGVQGGLDFLLKHWNSKCLPPWTETELRHKCEDAGRLLFNKPEGWLLENDNDDTAGGPDWFTDIGNARRFAKQYGADLRYVADREAWTVYNGKRWLFDGADVHVEAIAKQFAREWSMTAAQNVTKAAEAVAKAEGKAAEAVAREDGDGDAAIAKADEEKARKQLAIAKAELAAAKKLQDARSLRRMLSMARSEQAILVQCYRDTFDRKPELLNVPNGTIDLLTGKLLDHRREHYITKLAGVEYNSAATAPTYDRVLASIFGNDAALIAYVRRFAGIILTGDVSGQSFHVFHGCGSNGKSVLLELWLDMLRDYGLKLPSQALVHDRHAQRHPCEIADLAGARFAIATETDQSGELDETKVKELTGGDTIAARLMRQNFFRFDPTFKIVLCTNHKPRVAGTDHSIWRRIRLVPFNTKYWTDADRDTNPKGIYDTTLKADKRIPDLLRNELEGVLADAVREAVAFYATDRNHEPPKIVLASTREYRHAEDVLGQFCDEKLFPDCNGRTAHSTIYTNYSEWAKESDYKPVGKRGLSEYLTTRYGEPQKSDGRSCYPVRIRVVAGHGRRGS
jgi:putative DNA primase/helicase